MSEKTRYFKIGLFTLVSLVLLCIGLILFGAGSSFQAPPLICETYFAQSVQGLDVGAPVKFNGVKVGKVREIVFIRDEYGHDQSIESTVENYNMVGVKFEIEPKHFPKFKGKTLEEAQTIVNVLAEKYTLRAKMIGIGITGLSYLELGFADPDVVPPPIKILWKPKNLYIPSAPSVATRFNDAMDKMLNKMDTDIYPMIENINKASTELPPLVAKLNETMPYVKSIAKNIDDITSTGKKYPSQMIFGDAPHKSRYDQ